MAFKVNIFANKWNLAFKTKSLVDKITTSEWSSTPVKGDRITISALTGITVQDYVQGTEITYDNVGSSETTILMDKQKLVAPVVEDIDEIQTNPKLMDGVVSEGTNLIVGQVDSDVLAQLITDANTAGNTISATEALTSTNIVNELLIPARTFLNTADAPDEGRYIVVDPSTEALIQGADITLSDAGLEKNLVGRTMGMSIYWSNKLPANKCLIGVKEACGFGSSIKSVKTMDSEKQVGTAIQMLQVYGSKAVKPEGVAEYALFVA